MKIFLLLVYVMAGDLRVEKSDAKSLDACIEAADKRVAELVVDPQFSYGVFADCIEVDSRTI